MLIETAVDLFNVVVFYTGISLSLGWLMNGVSVLSWKTLTPVTGAVVTASLVARFAEVNPVDGVLFPFGLALLAVSMTLRYIIDFSIFKEKEKQL